MKNDRSFRKSNEANSHQLNEFSISQVFILLINYRKPLAMGVAGGLALGLGGALALGSYKSEMILDNSSKSIDLVSWRMLESRLPVVASHALERKLVKPEDIAQYKKLAESERTSGGSWFKNNISPTFSLSKSDFKNFASMSKEVQDSAGTLILNLAVSSLDASRENSIRNVKTMADFIQTGSAYLDLKNLIDSYETNLKNAEAQHKKKLSTVEIEILFAVQKAKNLEKLRLQFPGNVILGANQMMGTKDTGAKYLPISTQLVAVNSDLNDLNESVIRLDDQLMQQKISRDFLDRISPVFSTSLNGLILIEKMLLVLEDIRKNLDTSNIKQQNSVEGIHADLVTLQTRYSRFMDRSEVTTTHSGMVWPAIFGGMAGGVLVFIFLLGQRWSKRLKTESPALLN